MFGVSGSDSSVPGSPLPSVEDVDGKNVSLSPESWPPLEPQQWVLCHCVVYLPLHAAVGSVSLCRLLALAFAHCSGFCVSVSSTCCCFCTLQWVLCHLLALAFAHCSGFCVTVSSTCHYLVHIAVFFVVTVPSTVSSSYHCYVHLKIVFVVIV